MSTIISGKFVGIFILQIIAIIFAMLNLSDIKIEYVADFLPLFDVMIIYYFAVLNPKIFGFGFLFLLGLIADSIGNLPLGITSISYIFAVKIFVSINKKVSFQENFHQIFIQFIAFGFLILFFKVSILSLYYLKFYNVSRPLFQMLITSVVYVFMHKLFYFLYQKLYQKYLI